MGQPVWADQLVPIEIRAKDTGMDPFSKLKGDDEYGSVECARKRSFERISATAELLFAAQQRVFLFMLLVIGRRFRILRWDRAGVIFTPSVDYVKYPSILRDFLWRVSHLTDTDIGLDPTVTRVLPGDVDFLRMDLAALKKPSDVSHVERELESAEVKEPLVFDYVRSLFRISIGGDWPRYKLQVSDGTASRDYLVGKPTFRAPGAVGRGTRGYVALDCKTRRFVWLKDTWRASYMIPHAEGDVLQKLNAVGIDNVPTLVCHGDVGDQATVSGDWWEPKTPVQATPLSSSSSGSPDSPHTIPVPTSPGSKKRKRANATHADQQSQHGDSVPNATIDSDHPLRIHRHYRIVVEEVGLPLKNFQYGRQLAYVVLHCLRGKIVTSLIAR